MRSSGRMLQSEMGQDVVDGASHASLRTRSVRRAGVAWSMNRRGIWNGIGLSPS